MDISIDDALIRAMALSKAGDVARAKALFISVLEKEPTNGVANHQLGLLSFFEGDRLSAAAHLQQAVTSSPDEPEYLNNLGVALNSIGSYDLAQQAFQSAVAQDGNYLQARINLAASLAVAGVHGAAIAAYRAALEIDHGCIEARDNVDVACHQLAPQWHFPMMADTVRNEAYRDAICRAVVGRRVLDIGTGSGLLAMMAARAGASQVSTCEAVPEVAQVANKILEKNGYLGSVAVHAKNSKQLSVGAELDARADVLITETFSSGLLSEMVLPTIEHAWQHLLADDAQVIPNRAAARGCLIGGPMVEAQFFAPNWEGLDLTDFDFFAPNKIGLHLDRLPHDVLSDDFEILSFDLTQRTFNPERRVFSVTCSRSGRCAGVAQWLRLDLDAQTQYENRPANAASANGWMHILYRFAKPVDIKAGDILRLEAVHNLVAMAVTLALD